MQTVKCRVRWLKGGDPAKHQMWAVTHPDTSVELWSAIPHDGALHLLQKYVLPNQTDLVLK